MIYANALRHPEVIMFQSMKDPEPALSVRRVTSLEVSLFFPLEPRFCVSSEASWAHRLLRHIAADPADKGLVANAPPKLRPDILSNT